MGSEYRTGSFLNFGRHSNGGTSGHYIIKVFQVFSQLFSCIFAKKCRDFGHIGAFAVQPYQRVQVYSPVHIQGVHY